MIELSRLRREFFDRINKINKIFLYSLYLPAGRQVLNILSILSKKWDFLYYELSRLRRNFFDRINRINKIFLFSLYLPAGRQVLNILFQNSGTRKLSCPRKGNSYTMNLFCSLSSNKEEITTLMTSFFDIRVFRSLIGIQHDRSTDLAEKLSSDNDILVLLEYIHEI